MQQPRNAIHYLVAINIGVFVGVYVFHLKINNIFALFFPENPTFWPWQFLTHIFLHGGVTHILFNMYGLWAFGTPLLKLWGNTRFVLYFLVTGIGAGLFFTLANYFQFNSIYNELIAAGATPDAIQALIAKGRLTSQLQNGIPKEDITQLLSIYYSPVVGASGAIYAVLVAFAMIYPNAKLMLIFIPYPIKAMFFVPLIIAGDLFFGLTRYSVGNIAHFAHIGGAVVGLLIMMVWRGRIINKNSIEPE